MVRASWWQAVRQCMAPAVRRGRRPKHGPRSYRPWLDLLERRLAPTVTLSVSDPAPFPKPDTGQLLGLFVVTRSGDQAPEVLVDYATQDGSGPNGAHAGTDYVANAGTLVFAPYQVTAIIPVLITGNNVFQADKTFTVSLSTPRVGVTFAPYQTFATGSGPSAVAVGDFNGDGKPDLAVANHSSNTVSVLLNTTPVGRLPPASPPSRPSLPVAAPPPWRWGTSTGTASPTSPSLIISRTRFRCC